MTFIFKDYSNYKKIIDESNSTFKLNLSWQHWQIMLKHEFILQRMNHYYANMPWCGGLLSDESWKFDLHESIDGRRKVLNIIALLLRILKCSKYFYGDKPLCICNLFDSMTFSKIMLRLRISSTSKFVKMVYQQEILKF